MKSVYFLFFILLSLAIASSCQYPSENVSGKDQPDIDQLKQEVLDMFTLSMELFRNKDLDGLVNRFTGEGVIKIPRTPLIAGHEALRKYYTNTLQLENFDLDLRVTKVEVSTEGDMAYALADFEVSFETPMGPFLDKGNTLMVLKRADMNWKIAAEYLSSGGGAE
ncbi:MAG: YybH family protein [Bacteroidales bacterium]